MRVRLRPSETARAIALGLVRTGRALDTRVIAGDTLRLGRKAGGFYWLDFNGHELRQGPTLIDAEPLQGGFVAAMKVAGSDGTFAR